MPSDKVCCVPGCKSGVGTLHKFPDPEKNRERFNTWLYAIGGDILRLENAHIFKFRRVCSLHFLDKYMCSSKRLSYNAVPTLNIPGRNIGTERIPLQGLENLSTQSTSTAPEPVAPTPNKTGQAQENDNADDDESLNRLFEERPIRPPEKTFVKKKAPGTAVCEQVPPASQSTADTDSSDSQNISKTPHKVKKIIQKTLAPEPVSPTPNETGQGQEDDNADDDESLHQLFYDTPRRLPEKTIVKKKAPETAVCKQVPLASQSTADTDSSDSQNISKTPHKVKKIIHKTLGFEEMDSFKLKFKNILHSSKFCGICLESNESMNNVDENLEIIVHERTYAKPVRGLVDVVFKEANYSLASSYVCNSCLEKLIQSYIFIETALETSKIFGNYVNDLLSISNNIFNHLPESKIKIKNVVIELENNIHDSLEGKNESNNDESNSNETFEEENNIHDSLEGKDENNSNETFEEENEVKLIRQKFICVRCLSMLPTHRALKIHKMKCKKQIFRCRTCLKRFRNKDHLKAHHKLHLKVKCRFCHEILHKNELLDHFKTNHEDTLIKCSKCELFYSLKTYQSHTRDCQQIKEDKEQCLMCLKTFTANELKSHICKHSCPECTEVPCMHYKYLKSYREQILNNADKIKCFYCDFVCKKKEILLGHVNRDHFNYPPYICDKCGKQFYSKVVLRAHILRFHENCFVCQICDSEFSNINNYEWHVKSCEDIKRVFACENCPASFNSSKSLMDHVERRHSADIFPCGLCNKKFLKDYKRKEHMVKVHSNLEIKIRVKKVRCVLCLEMFYNKKDLGQHMKRSHGPNITYPCTICNIEFYTVKQFQSHNYKHKGPFATCHVCGKEVREILLEKHLTTHSKARDLEICETCGRSFKNNTLLKYHQKDHLGSVPCPKCKKMMKPSRLRRHLQRHLMEENPEKKEQPKSKCKFCEYKTWDNTLLEAHINRHHLKIKPYVCHLCRKGFFGKKLLRAHIRTHYMRSVVCMICLKSFTTSTSLKNHMRIHTGEKPCTCEICGERFRLKTMMALHKLRKHSDKTKICPLCSKTFHTIRDVRRHIIRVHWKLKDKSCDPRDLKGLDEKYYHLFHDGRRVKLDDKDIEFYIPT